VPSREAVLGFVFGVAVIVAGSLFDLPGWLGVLLLVFIFGGWLSFAIRDRLGRPADG
jgi:hypothetical protein